MSEVVTVRINIVAGNGLGGPFVEEGRDGKEAERVSACKES